jgi:zinc and cadmium transporter
MNFFTDTALYFALITGAVIFGGILPVFRHWDEDKLPLFLSLSAGLMLGSSFMHLMPNSFELVGPSTGVYVLFGLLFLYLFEKFITVHICEADHCEVHKLGISAFIGLFLHALTDGVALGAGLLVPRLGFIVFIAIFAHKAMEAFSLSSILIHGQKSRTQIFLANGALLLAIPLGAALAFLFAGTQNNERATGIALAFSAGTFLHVALSDLLPEVHRHSKLKNSAMAFFILGLLLMFLLEKYLEV